MGLGVLASVELDVGLDVVADVELVGLDVGLVSRARCGVASLHGHCVGPADCGLASRARCGGLLLPSLRRAMCGRLYRWLEGRQYVYRRAVSRSQDGGEGAVVALRPVCCIPPDANEPKRR